MSIFAGIEHKSGAVGRGSDITPGAYLFETLSVEDGLTPFTKEEYFKVKVRVLESSGGEVPDKEGKMVRPLPADTETEVFVGKDKFGYYVTDIKNLGSVIASGMAGEEVKPSEIEESDLRELCSEAQPGKGIKFRGTFSPKPGKFTKNGLPVCIRSFAAVIES